MSIHRLIIVSILISICILLLAPVMVNAASTNMLAGSFLTEPINSIGELTKLIQNERLVALRFSKHFGMLPSTLVQYFQNNLVVSTIDKTGTYKVYFIGQNGRIESEDRQLKAGTRVLVNKDGSIVFDLTHGNPLVKSLPKYGVPSSATGQMPQPLTQDGLYGQGVEPTGVDVLPQPTDAVIETTPAAGVEGGSGISSLFKNSKWLVPAIIGVGAIVAISDNGGDEEPIPEPASLLVLGVGMLGLAARFYKKPTR